MIVPVDVPLDGGTQTDASGNYSFTTQIHPSNWSVVRLVGQTSGSPRWSLLSDSNLPLDFAVGPLASMGLVLVAPGQRLTTQISAALPAASVNGHYVGVMSPSLAEVLPFYLPSPNPIGSTVFGTTTDLGQVSDTNAVGTTKTLLLPIGTIALQILPSASPPTSVTITGTKSRDVYFSVTGITANPYYVIAPQSGFEPQLDVTVTARAFQTNTVEIIALTTPVAQATIITGVGSTGISGGQDTSFGGGSSIPVVPALTYNPTLWQAPTGIVSGFATGATTTLLAGVAGQRIRNWDGIVEINTAAAGTQSTVQDSIGSVLAQFSSGTIQNFSCGFIAKPCALSAGLQLVAAAAATVVYSGGTSQG